MDNQLYSVNIDGIFNKIIKIVREKQHIAAREVNASLIFLYWEVGEAITVGVLNHEKPEYGKRIVADLSDRLSVQYGKGFNKSNITRMIKFYQEFPDKQKVATLSQQLTWSHFVELITIDNDIKRDFYAAMCSKENWNVRTLRERKQSMLFERTAISSKPDETIRQEIDQLMNDNKMSLDLFYRDPYVLDFLGLKDTYSEKDLENAILAEIERFILEMGSDFAFLARQKHFVLDGKDYFMDLLFYHRTLRRLVLIELKLGEFQPEHKGQVELYLRWLDKYERAEGEETPIALILCAEKSQETIELMELDKDSIHVAQYLTKLPPKKMLEEKLAAAIETAGRQIELKE